jgi:hypothetical protein
MVPYQFDHYYVLYHKKEEKFYTDSNVQGFTVVNVFLTRQNIIDFKKTLPNPHGWIILKIYFAQ